MEKRKVLGRGLDTLLPSRYAATPTAAAAAPQKHDGELVLQIPVEDIDSNPYQTRLAVDEAALAELTVSIKSIGVLQPITVRPAGPGRYQIVAGERRWLASKQAGKPTIPAIVRHVSNQQAMQLTIIENLQREDLNPIEQARAFERFANEFGLTQEQISEITGMDRVSVANHVRMLKLPPRVQHLIATGVLTLGHGKVLLSLDDDEHIGQVAEWAVASGMSVRDTEEYLNEFRDPEKKTKKKKRVVDPNVREVEERLQRALGVRVLINDRKGKGRIILEYHSLEDFDRILVALRGKQ